MTSEFIVTAIEAMRSNNPQGAKAALSETGINVNEKDSEGYSALYIATAYGFKDIVKLLLDKGAEVNEKGVLDRTPLYLAAYDGYLEIVQMLVDKGAKLDAKTVEGDTALMAAERNGYKRVARVLREADEHAASPAAQFTEAAAVQTSPAEAKAEAVKQPQPAAKKPFWKFF